MNLIPYVTCLYVLLHWNCLSYTKLFIFCHGCLLAILLNTKQKYNFLRFWLLFVFYVEYGLYIQRFSNPTLVFSLCFLRISLSFLKHISRGILRTQSNIYDEAFLQKQLTAKSQTSFLLMTFKRQRTGVELSFQYQPGSGQ